MGVNRASKEYNMNVIKNDKYFEEKLEHLARLREETGNFERDLFNLGRDCFFNSELMQGLDEETLNNKSFLSGYNHGKRLALIEEMQEKNSKSK